jgi:DNA topoisomerase-1
MSHSSEPQTIVDCKDAAESVGLSYASTDEPGIRRRRAGKGFSYRGPDGKVINDKAAVARIRTLAIPPAWENVWICADPNGHIQAVGYDARGRKQYRFTRNFGRFARM